MATSSEQEERTTDEVQREIVETRAELDNTLDEVGRRLSPDEIKQRAFHYARESVADLIHTFQRNPMRPALGGAIVGTTLLVRHFRQARAAAEQAEQIGAIWDRICAALAEPREPSAVAQAVSKTADIAQEARQRLSQVADDAGSYLREVGSEPAKHVIEPAKRVIALLEKTPQQQLVAMGLMMMMGAALATMLRR